MNLYGKCLVGGLLSMSLLATVQGASSCVADSPLALARLLQAEQYYFYAEPEPAAAMLSPRLLGLVRAEAACTEQEGLCALDADPWMNVQDGEMGKPLRFKELSNDGATAEVELRYPFVLDPTQTVTEERRMHLIFARGADCWQLDDLLGPDKGGSLVKQLTP